MFRPDVRYGLEKFSGAVTSLATHHGTLRERLPRAWIYDLSHVRRAHMPDDISWSRVEKIGRAFRRVDGGEEGSAVASMRRVRIITLVQLAREIVELRDLLESAAQRLSIEEECGS